MTLPNRLRSSSGTGGVTVDLSAVIVAASPDGPRVLVRQPGTNLPVALPSGPLEAHHRTLDAGLRSWVEELVGYRLGYVEQLYTFGDANRHASARGVPNRALSIGYLALVRESRAKQDHDVTWVSWYRFFPWEDRRHGEPAVMALVREGIAGWIAEAPGDERKHREERAGLAFGRAGERWNEELALERYELLYEIGLVPEAHRDGAAVWAPREAVILEGDILLADHRRILATGISRLRSKIKYRPVVFELMPPRFTFLQLQRTVEALAGVELHKPNFRRLVKHQGLVEETGAVASNTVGRPARLIRFRRDVLLERPASGVGLPAATSRRDLTRN
jgi:hypothetical protein